MPSDGETGRTHEDTFGVSFRHICAAFRLHRGFSAFVFESILAGFPLCVDTKYETAKNHVTACFVTCAMSRPLLCVLELYKFAFDMTTVTLVV